MVNTTQNVVKHAWTVMRELGIGHKENIYHKALSACLSKANLHHRMEVVTPIMFMGECVGFGRADIVMDGLVLEIKAVTKCPAQASGQLRKYMESLGRVEDKQCEGMVINFNQSTGKVEAFLETPLKKSVTTERRVTSRFFGESVKKRKIN